LIQIDATDSPIFAELALNPKQGEFVTDMTPFLLASGGKGGGKTVGLNVKTIALLTSSDLFGDCSGNVGCIGRYREKDLRNTTLKELWNWLPRAWVRKENKDEGWIEMWNESVLFTTHYDNIQHITSFNLGFAALDQAEEVPIDVFDELAYNRIRLKVMKRYRTGSKPPVLVKPKFSDIEPYECISTDPEELAAVVKFNTIFGVANPRPSALCYKFIKNEEYRNAKDEETRSLYNPDFKLIDIPTTENAKWLPTGYIARQKRDKTARAYARDVLGQWNAFEGIIHIDFTEDLIGDRNINPHPDWKMYVGVDHGGSSNTDAGRTINITAVVFLAVEPRPGDFDLVHVIDELYLPGSTIEETVAAIDNKLQAIQTGVAYEHQIDPTKLDYRFPVEAWRCDPSMARQAGDGSVETIMARYMRFADMRGMDMPLAPGDNDVAGGIEKVNWLHRRKLLRVNPRCVNFINEHRAYEYGNDEKPKGKQADHAVTGFRYVASALPFWYYEYEIPRPEKSRMQQQIDRYRKQTSGAADSIFGNRYAGAGNAR
jgi:hypothetical protein